MGEVDSVNYITKRLEKFIEKHGYIPKFFNPYNCADLHELAPTVTVWCGGLTTSSGIMYFEKQGEETREERIPMNKPSEPCGLTLNDLFCGAGGIGLAFQQAGFNIRGAWDFDKYAVESYRANVGDHVKQADITQMRFWNLPKADVWSFGFPCQDLSVAGKQAGLFEGKRSGLFFEVMRLLDEAMEYEPKTMPKILLAENVKGLKPYLEVLQQEYKKRGYTAHIALFNSKYWGVPQNRERYFIVGTRDDLDLTFNFPTQRTDFVPKLSSILETNVDEKYYLSDEKAKTILDQVMKPDQCGRTLRVGGKGSLSFKHNYEHIADGYRVRKLTVREYARLQGFPESFEIVVSNSQAYKQFGNAVTVNVVRAIAGEIKRTLTGEEPEKLNFTERPQGR